MNAVFCFTVLLAVVCLSGAMNPEYKKKLMSSLAECMKEHNMKKEEVIDMVKNEKLPEDKEKQCFIGCTFDKMGYVKDLTLDWGLMKAANPEKFDTPEGVEKANQVADACAKTVSGKEANICDLGVKAIKCIHDEAEKVQLPKPEFSFE